MGTEKGGFQVVEVDCCRHHRLRSQSSKRTKLKISPVLTPTPKLRQDHQDDDVPPKIKGRWKAEVPFVRARGRINGSTRPRVKVRKIDLK